MPQKYERKKTFFRLKKIRLMFLSMNNWLFYFLITHPNAVYMILLMSKNEKLTAIHNQNAITS